MEFSGNRLLAGGGYRIRFHLQIRLGWKAQKAERGRRKVQHYVYTIFCRQVWISNLREKLFTRKIWSNSQIHWYTTSARYRVPVLTIYELIIDYSYCCRSFVARDCIYLSRIEESAWTPGVLDCDGWKKRFNVKTKHRHIDRTVAVVCYTLYTRTSIYHTLFIECVRQQLIVDHNIFGNK